MLIANTQREEEMLFYIQIKVLSFLILFSDLNSFNAQRRVKRMEQTIFSQSSNIKFEVLFTPTSQSESTTTLQTLPVINEAFQTNPTSQISPCEVNNQIPTMPMLDPPSSFTTAPIDTTVTNQSDDDEDQY